MRSSAPLVLLAGLALLAAAGGVYLALLTSTFGPLTTADPKRPALDGGRVALLVSGYTAEVNAARGARGLAPGWLAANAETWRAFLRQADAEFDEVSDADVEAGRLEDYGLLVLPAASALSDLQVERVKAFLEDGRSVLATWTPGIYRPDGSWRGWAFVEETFGVGVEGFVERGHAGFRVYADTFPGLARPGLYETAAQGDAASGFAPLSGYAWAGPLDAERPAADFALADTLGSATRVEFFAWLGGDPAAAAEAALDGSFRRVSFRTGTPLTAGLPASYRMRTGTFDAPLTMRVAEPRTAPLASWFDFAADDRPAAEALPTSAASVFGTYGAGRFIFLGHELSAMGYDPADQGVLARLFENALAWLARRPVAWVEPWPAPHRHAALVAGIAEGDPRPLADALGPFREADAPATLFLTADAAEGYPELARRLSASADLGLLAAPGLPAGALRQARHRFAATAGDAPAGFRPSRAGAVRPEAAQALVRAGFAYALADTLARSLAPAVIEEGLVVIPKTARTDREVLARTPAGTAAIRAAMLREDVARTEAEGGLYTLAFHADALAQPEHLALLRETLGTLRARGFWLASGRDLAAWWAARDGLRTAVERVGPRRLRIRVSNEGARRTDRAAVAVALGHAVADVRVRTELVGAPEPAVTLEEDGLMLRLAVGPLEPGGYRTYQVDLAWPEAPGPAPTGTAVPSPASP